MSVAKEMLSAAGRPLGTIFGFVFGWLGSPTRSVMIIFLVILLVLLGVAGYFAVGAYGGYLRLMTPGPFVHPNASCNTGGCHSNPSKQGKMYVAVDGHELSDSQTIQKSVGDYLEVSFHFTGLRGDPKRFTGVGMAIELPKDGSWRLNRGSERHPDNWTADTTDPARAWSLAWGRSANGHSGSSVRWMVSSDKPYVYYADFSASKWAVPKFILSANDLGDASDADQDGLANHMGSNAVVNIPTNIPTGSYNIIVMGVGHDPDGSRVYASKSITVEVTTNLPYAQAVERGRNIFTGACAICHGPDGKKQKTVSLFDPGFLAKWNDTDIKRMILEGRGQMPAQGTERGGNLTEQDAMSVISYMKSMSFLGAAYEKPEAAVARAQGGSSFGGPSGLTGPPSSSEAINQPSGTAATGVITAAISAASSASAIVVEVPKVPHETTILKECLTCHGPNGLKPVPPNHARRTEPNCLDCHQSVAAKDGPPTVVHKLEHREFCTACHFIGAGPRPLPQTHATRNVSECLICHKYPPTAPHSITDGQSDCRSCHSKLPDSHKDRADGTCTTCHSGPIALPDQVTTWVNRPRTPQPKVQPQLLLSSQLKVDAPPPPDPPGAKPPAMGHKALDHEMCLSCHGPEGHFVKQVPASHAGRGEETCTMCHRVPPTAKHGFGQDTTGCYICHHNLNDNHSTRGGNCVKCHIPKPD